MRWNMFVLTRWLFVFCYYKKANRSRFYLFNGLAATPEDDEALFLSENSLSINFTGILKGPRLRPSPKARQARQVREMKEQWRLIDDMIVETGNKAVQYPE